MFDAILHTRTCSVCGYARGISGVRLACCCRGWVVFWRQRLARKEVAKEDVAKEDVSGA